MSGSNYESIQHYLADNSVNIELPSNTAELEKLIRETLLQQDFRDLSVTKACESFVKMNRLNVGRELRIQLWDENWDTDYVNLILRQGRQHPETANRIARMVNGIENKRVLELGCGYGRMATELHKLGADVTAMDINGDYLSIAKYVAMGQGIWPNRDIQFHQSAAENLPYPDDTFDIIWSDQTIEHVNNVESSLREMVRVIKPSGLIFVRCPNYLDFKMREPHFGTFWPPFLPRIIYRNILANEYKNRFRKISKQPKNLPANAEQLLLAEVLDELNYINFIKPYQVTRVFDTEPRCDWGYVRSQYGISKEFWKNIIKRLLKSIKFDVWLKSPVFVLATKNAKLSEIIGSDSGQIWHKEF